MIQVENVKADQMRELASRNKTSYGLLLYLALEAKTQETLNLTQVMNDLQSRGVEVNETHLYDTFQELEDFGLGSIIYAKRGQGDDMFKRDYDLRKYARRAFTVEYLYNWESKLGQEENSKVKLVDNKFKFQQTAEEKSEEKKNSGRRGRPVGYSHKLGRYFTPEEMKAREAKMNNPNPRGRPVGWRKYPEGAKRLAKTGTGKRGRPPGYSPKLGRFLTAQELIAKAKNVPTNKPGRPVGWRKNTEKATPKFKETSYMTQNVSKMRILSIPLKNNRTIRIELPKNLNSDEKALLKLNLETIL